MRELVSSGVKIDYYFQGLTPLLLSLLRDQQNVANILIDSGCNILLPEKTKFARQPIHLAAYMGHVQIVKSLLERGASIHAADGVMMTPLHWAAYAGRFEVTKYLLDFGAHVNCRDDVGCTALHRAAESGHTHVVQLLIESGALLNIQDVFGWPPLFQAAMCGLRDVVMNLLLAGAQISSKDIVGHSVLHVVCGRLLPHILSILSSRNVNVLQRKVVMVTPALSLALHSSTQDDLAMLLLLIDMGADVNWLSGDGKTPLRYAAEEGNDKLIAPLVHAGSNLALELWIFEENWPSKFVESPTCQWLKRMASVRVASLFVLCRQIVRKTLNTNVNAKVATLPLPTAVKLSLIV